MSARYPLPAARHPIAARFLTDGAAVAEAIERFGSPLHVVFPQVMAENAAALADVLRRHAVPHEVFYAHKVNASTALVNQAAAAGLGVDVASSAELDRALAAGFAPHRIEATGPKSPAFVERIASLGVTANADDLWELDRLAAAAPSGQPSGQPSGSNVPVLLRLSGFASPMVPHSRFGIDLADADAALETVRRAPGLELRGVAFHLDTADPAARVDALTESMAVVAAAYRKGLRPSVVDIGGGLRQRFVEDPEPFQRYAQALAAGPGELVWPGHDVVAPAAHKYGNHRPATEVLERFLTAEIERRPVAEVLRECMLTLWIEPGKALVDHAGITLASVLYRKRAAGRDLVVLDLSRNQVTPADQEVLVDPVVVDGRADPPEEGVFLAGRLCLESDLISRRKVFLDAEPDSGDVLAFVNTAAYQMDLSASSAAGHPPPPKVAAVLDGDRFTFTADTLADAPDDHHRS